MESKTERSMPSTASNGAIENLLTLHGYSRAWSTDGDCWVVSLHSAPTHSFIMNANSTLEEWVATLQWYADTYKGGEASTFFSPYFKAKR